MKYITPQIFHIAQPKIDRDGLQDFLNTIGVPDWESDAHSDEEELVEIMGRLCYKSFAIDLNPNLEGLTEHNDKYLGNIANQHHGSVVEHPYDSYIIWHSSRVFTHELVRHRAGTAFSQESLRYVRLTEINFWFPQCFKDHPQANELRDVSDEILRKLEWGQREFAKILGLDELSSDLNRRERFDIKKLYTSAMRRWAPIGLATAIGLSINPRAARWVIEMRTSRHSEEEIRYIFSLIYEDLQSRYPALYQDAQSEMIKGIPEITFKNSKI